MFIKHNCLQNQIEYITIKKKKILDAIFEDPKLLSILEAKVVPLTLLFWMSVMVDFPSSHSSEGTIQLLANFKLSLNRKNISFCLIGNFF